MPAESKFDTMSFGYKTVLTQHQIKRTAKDNVLQPNWRQKNCKTEMSQNWKKVAHKIKGCVFCKCTYNE